MTGAAGRPPINSLQSFAGAEIIRATFIIGCYFLIFLLHFLAAAGASRPYKIMSEFLTAIQTLGFPIAACIACAWYVKYITDQNNTRMDQLNSQHRDEISKVTEALNNNTLALQHITDVFALGGYNADSTREP